MSLAALTILAFSMSIDAWVASVGRGAGMVRPRLVDAVRTGAVFGCVEMITPLIGWAAGVAASAYVREVDHWIAFGLLLAVGGRMTFHALRRSEDEPPVSGRRSLLMLLATAVGTSIDAMAVGVSLAFLDVNIVMVAVAIGLATFVMSTGGVLTGRFIGERWGRLAEVTGGLVLMGLGTYILATHLAG